MACHFTCMSGFFLGLRSIVSKGFTVSALWVLFDHCRVYLCVLDFVI